jgi:tRNA-dihydrouridine synthase B
LVHIGDYQLNSRIVLAPMAGITDTPFRNLCRKFSAGACTAEMLTSDVTLWESRKSGYRLPNATWAEPRIVQIAGSDPEQMAEAAKRCADNGAQIIDINMGCPAKKVCKKEAGSALLKNEPLVADILRAVTNATELPTTLKIRTGWNKQHRNAPTIAAIAQDVGIQALAVHGRTRDCLFRGLAEYETVIKIVQKVTIPVFANGDISSPDDAKNVLAHTGAAGVMIGRGAMGQPWLFAQINHLLATGEYLPNPSMKEIRTCIRQHLNEIREYYPIKIAVKLARKHISSYLQRLGCPRDLRRGFATLESPGLQDKFLSTHLSPLNNNIWKQTA